MDWLSTSSSCRPAGSWDPSTTACPPWRMTPGGDRVAWLNAGRGRVLGPARTQEVQIGGKVKLSVHGKYEVPHQDRLNAGAVANWGSKTKLIDDLLEFSTVTTRSASPNAVTVLNILDILIKELQKKEAPEAYIIYALYDGDSVLYETEDGALKKALVKLFSDGPGCRAGY